MGLLAAMKPLVERLPFAARSFRVARDWARFRSARPAPTPLGFLFAGQSAMCDGTFEPWETRFLREAISDADLFIDIGANIGYFTCLARAAGVSTIAVEPLHDNRTDG